MRISDWSSDVCSSDLHQRDQRQVRAEHPARAADVGYFHALDHGDMELSRQSQDGGKREQGLADEAHRTVVDPQRARGLGQSTEERTVGTECVSTCRTGRSAYL